MPKSVETLLQIIVNYLLINTSQYHLNEALSLTEEITRSFRQFGPLVVDWPHKAEMKSYFPPKGTDVSHMFSQRLSESSAN